MCVCILSGHNDLNLTISLTYNCIGLHTFCCRMLRAFAIQKRRNEVVCHCLPSDWFRFLRLGVVFQTSQGKGFLYKGQKTQSSQLHMDTIYNKRQWWYFLFLGDSVFPTIVTYITYLLTFLSSCLTLNG